MPPLKNKKVRTIFTVALWRNYTRTDLYSALIFSLFYTRNIEKMV